MFKTKQVTDCKTPRKHDFASETEPKAEEPEECEVYYFRLACPNHCIITKI